MTKQRKENLPKIAFLESIWLLFLILLALGGLYLIIHKTGFNTSNRYSFPRQILPGIALLYTFSFALAGTVVKKPGAFSVFLNLRKFMVERINVESASKLKNMVLLGTFFVIAYALTDGNSSRAPWFAKTYFFGLFINIFISFILIYGVFGWSFYLFLSKNSKGKS